MIYEIKRDNVVIFQHEIKGNRTQSAPAVDFVDIEFDYYEAILLKRNDTIEFDGQIYYCDRQYANYQKKSNNLYNHKARFVSENYRATEIAVLDPQDVSKFEVEGNLLTLLTLAVDNLNRVSSGWSYATPVPNTVTKLFIIEEENVMSFLTKVSGEFEIPFYIKNKVVTFAYPNITDEGDFSYGKGNGFLDINKSYKSGEKVPNTIYVTGGDDLVLDDPVVHTGDVNINGVIEGFYHNDNIKPTTRTQVVGSTSTENVATTNLINYDLNLYKIAGKSPIINFETGALAGLSFFVTKFDYNVINNVSLIYFKKRFVDGTEYPNSSAKPNNGDFFNITNITQPQAVIDEAKITLKTRAESYLNDLILKNLVLKVNLDPLFDEDLELNNRIRVVDNNLDIDDYFIVNEIKTDLQNLNKKELQLEHIGRTAFAFTLPTKNDNIIELGIDRNYDDLVAIEDEMVLVKADMERVNVDLEAVEINVSDLELSVENIETVELPLKESIGNKVDINEVEAPTPLQYPNAKSVKDALDLKQNTLIQGSNINITSDTISVKVNSVTQTIPANTVTNAPNSTYAVQNDTNGNLVVNVPSDNTPPIYHHFSAQTTVTVLHNRGMYASVGVMLGTEMVLSNIDQDVSMNSVTVNFSTPQTGIIILNF